MVFSGEVGLEQCTAREVGELNRIARHPDVLEWASDDHCPTVDRIDMGPVVASPQILVLLIRVQGEAAGFFLTVSHSLSLLEVHTAIVPEYRGRIAGLAARQAVSFLFAQPRCVKLMTLVPRMNRAAALFARRAGFVLEGCLTQSFLKRGRLHDQQVFGLTKAAYEARCRDGASERDGAA